MRKIHLTELTYSLRALWHIRPSQSLLSTTRLAATVFTSSYDFHPASAYSFSTVRLKVRGERVISPQPNPQPGGPGDHT